MRPMQTRTFSKKCRFSWKNALLAYWMDGQRGSGKSAKSKIETQDHRTRDTQKKVWNAIKDFIPKYLCNIMNFTYRYHIWDLSHWCWCSYCSTAANRSDQPQPVSNVPTLHPYYTPPPPLHRNRNSIHCPNCMVVSQMQFQMAKWFRRCLKYDTGKSSW